MTGSEDERGRRVGLNEALFRELNERIHELHETFAAGADQAEEIVCECGKVECAQRIAIAPGAYEKLRAEPDTFAVTPGHELPDVEFVVERRPEYFVVRKAPGTPAQVAEATDPRP